MSKGFMRSDRRVLHRAVTGFSAVLPSKYAGISFSATITACSYPDSLPSCDSLGVARLVRATLRAAAADVTRRCDPTDLPTTQDHCAHHLAKPQELPGHVNVFAHGVIRLELGENDKMAVNSMIEAQRRQAIEDVVFEQRSRARARAFADPAVLLANHMLMGDVQSPGKPEVSELEKVASIFGELRNDDQPFEVQLLGILRSFLNGFEEQHQKQLLVTMLASGMRRLNGDEHAQALEAFAAEQGPTGEPRVSP